MYSLGQAAMGREGDGCSSKVFAHDEGRVYRNGESATGGGGGGKQ